MTSGLAEGEKIIVDGYQVLEPGDQIVCEDIEQSNQGQLVKDQKNSDENAGQSKTDAHNKLTVKTH